VLKRLAADSTKSLDIDSGDVDDRSP
jgi:hypothetical protein